MRIFVMTWGVLYSMVIISDLRNIATKTFPMPRTPVTLKDLVRQIIVEFIIVLTAIACLVAQ